MFGLYFNVNIFNPLLQSKPTHTCANAICPWPEKVSYHMYSLMYSVLEITFCSDWDQLNHSKIPKIFFFWKHLLTPLTTAAEKNMYF